MAIQIPYGHTFLQLDWDFPSWEVLSAHAGIPVSCSQEACIRKAMEAPVNSPALEELARNVPDAVIIISDHTRPVPSRLILPPMLEALRRGNPRIRITLLVATGCHRGTTEEELRRKLGDDIFDRETVVVHDCDDEKNMVLLGMLPSGAPLRINRLAAQASLLLAEGFIEPHFFAGFSGGRKSVLPGICSRETVMSNHCAALIDHPLSRTGILEGNPIHRDMATAAKMAKLRYIVNVLLDGDKRVIHAVAGDPDSAHREGCRVMGQMARVQPNRPGDIVITSNGGAPLDQNIYQAVKSLSTAEAAAAEGAAIIVCAACSDGIGGEHFYRALKDCASPTALLQQLRKIPAEETVPDQWQYQILCRILEKHRVFFVTDPALRQAVEDMKMTWCETLKEAVGRATALHPQGHVVIIPDGVCAICAEAKEEAK